MSWDNLPLAIHSGNFGSRAPTFTICKIDFTNCSNSHNILKINVKERTYIKLLSERLHDKRSPVQVVVGPRQIGKTTSLKELLAGKGVYETADSPQTLPANLIEVWWEKALQDKNKILAIDEVQKISGWSEVIKKLWDENPHALRVILTGSSALLVEKGLRESLAGRFELIRAEHWNFSEAKNILELSREQFIEFGCYPGSVRFLDDIPRWAAYVRDSIVEPAIGRDLLLLHPVENPALLRQLFGLATTLPAQIVSLQKLLGALQAPGTLPTLQSYLHLLGQAFLVTGIQKYSPAPFRARKSIPKLIVHDNALLRAFERPVETQLSPKRRGQYFENLIGARFLESGWDTFYWKERDLEVDFVVFGPNGEKWAIEVKTVKTNSKDLKGLHEFCRRHPNFEPRLVSLIGQKIEDVVTVETDEILSLTRKL